MLLRTKCSLKTNKTTTKKNPALKQTYFKTDSCLVLRSHFFVLLSSAQKKRKKIRKNRSWHKCLKGVCSESASTVTNIDFYASLCTLKCLFPPADLPLCIALHSQTPSSRGRGGGERKKQSCGALGVCSCCGVGGTAQEGTTESV